MFLLEVLIFFSNDGARPLFAPVKAFPNHKAELGGEGQDNGLV